MLLRDMICQTSARTLSEYLCLKSDGDCVEGSFIPMSIITCNLLVNNIDVNFTTQLLETDLQIDAIDAILSEEILSADLSSATITGEIKCH